MNLLDIVSYFAIAAIGSAINAVAGGGTFLAFPVLILGGVDALQANIISTIALWPGSVASAFAFRSERTANIRELLPFILISVAGSAVGAAILLLTPVRVFSTMVPWLMLGATLLFTFGRFFLRQPAEVQPQQKHPFVAYMLMMLIAIYGGYFGAGIGILMLAMLQLMGHSNIHQMNALKTVLGSAINAVAWVVFAVSGIVRWDIAGVMIMGGIAGGYVGARLSLRVPPKKIRLLVSVIGFTMTALFFVRGV